MLYESSMPVVAVAAGPVAVVMLGTSVAAAAAVVVVLSVNSSSECTLSVFNRGKSLLVSAVSAVPVDRVLLPAAMLVLLAG